jgi:hypothetical protein
MQPAGETPDRPANGPVLKPGMEHPDIALLRQRLKVPAEGGREALYDPAAAGRSPPSSATTR